MRESRVDMHVCVMVVSSRHTGASSFHVGVMYVRECSCGFASLCQFKPHHREFTLCERVCVNARV